ncbi:unnamed protein product [Ectocarpus sp. 12 AP-2014]
MLRIGREQQLRTMQEIHRPAEPGHAAAAAAQPTQVSATYKRLCARRKRACDSRKPRCSYCIEKKRPYCFYRLKSATKPGAEDQLSLSSTFPASWGVVSTAMRPANPPRVASHGGMEVLATAADILSIPTVPEYPSFKSRCRLSASPATGLVGMKENGFLCDFFGCFGILPLTTESTVRNAMVEIMMGVEPPRKSYNEEHLGVRTRWAEDEGEGEKGWSGDRTVVRRGTPPDHAAMCMMWCAIALGALMRGVPVEHVERYVSFARESLAECFDGRSIEHARAYLTMSFLHGILLDEDKNERYLSFAMDIVSQLGPEKAPKDLGAMLLTAEKMRLFKKMGCSRVRTDDLTAYCNNVVELPQVDNIVMKKDLCHLFLVTDRRLNQAFVADMTSSGALAAVRGAARRKENKEPVQGESHREWGGGGMVETNDERARGKGKQGLASDDKESVDRLHDEPKVPPSGAAMKRFVQETLPEITRLTKTLERSNVCSGVGGFFYHSNVAYMKAVNGDLEDLIRCLQASVDVVLRYPGIVRFRPHFIHCTLAVSHFSKRRDMYDAMSVAYNSIRPPGCWRAPPYEEWRTITQICDNMFCRSFEAEIHNAHHGEEPLQTNVSGDEDVTFGSASGLMKSPCIGVERQNSGSLPAELASGEQRLPAPMTATDATAVPSPLAELPHAPPSLSEDGVGNNDTAADDAEDMRWQPMAETAMLIPKSVFSAEAAEAGGVRAGWSSAAAASGQQYCSEGNIGGGSTAAAAVVTLNPTVGPEVWGGDVALGGSDMALTDEDLLDAAAVFANDEGLLEMGLV